MSGCNERLIAARVSRVLLPTRLCRRAAFGIYLCVIRLAAGKRARSTPDSTGSSLWQRHSVGPDPASRWCPGPMWGLRGLSSLEQSRVAELRRSVSQPRSPRRRSWRSGGDSVCSAAYFAVGDRELILSPPRAGMPYRTMRASRSAERVTATIVTVALASIGILKWTPRSTRQGRDSNPRHGRDRAVCYARLHHLGAIALKGIDGVSNAMYSDE